MTSPAQPGPARDEVQAHRGASAVAPENTIAAFRAAAEQGARWVELDVALLTDGTLVVIHDDSVDRTTSGTGNLGALTTADLDRLDAGGWFDPRFAGERLRTLSAAIAALGELGLGANIEIKQHKYHRSLDQPVTAVHRAVSLRRPEMPVMISSFDPDALAAMHSLAPELELAMLWSELPADWEARVAAIPARTIHLNYRALSIRFLEMARAQKIKVRAWTCNDPIQLVSFWGAGLTGVITDNPKVYLG